jgi:protein-tyrosine phosphatase
VSERVLPLAGGRNFRDLGGYETRDGRRLKWGCLFRSGVLAYLTVEDRNQLDQLRIRTLCDLRTRDEREREPTEWSSQAMKKVNWDYDKDRVSLRSLVGTSGFTACEAHAAMVSLYQRLPWAFAEQYSGVFAHLAGDGLPLMFHCSAGKDRTGMLAALVLEALGVPRAQIFADYVLTDSAIDLERVLFGNARGSIGLGAEHALLARTRREDRRPLLAASPDYLQAAFDQIELENRSVHDYLRTALEVSDESLARMRANLVEAS